MKTLLHVRCQRLGKRHRLEQQREGARKRLLAAARTRQARGRRRHRPSCAGLPRVRWFAPAAFFVRWFRPPLAKEHLTFTFLDHSTRYMTKHRPGGGVLFATPPVPDCPGASSSAAGGSPWTSRRSWRSRRITCGGAGAIVVVRVDPSDLTLVCTKSAGASGAVLTRNSKGASPASTARSADSSRPS